MIQLLQTTMAALALSGWPTAQGQRPGSSTVKPANAEIYRFYRSYEEMTRRRDADGLKGEFQKASKDLTLRLPNDSKGYDTLTLGEFISNIRQFYGLVKETQSVEAKVLKIRKSQGNIVVQVRYRESYLLGVGDGKTKLVREAEGLDLWQSTPAGPKLRSYSIQSEKTQPIAANPS